MLDFLIKAALKHRLLTLSMVALCLVYGYITGRSLHVDVFPDLNKPTVHVLTELPGMAPEEMETTVSRPLELAMNGVPAVTRVYSSSATGLSVIRVEFSWGTDLRIARANVLERLASVRSRLPKDVEPWLSPSSSIMGEIQMLGLTAEGPEMDLMKLRGLADWELKPRLLSIPGVAQVTVIGGEKEQVEIAIKPERLRVRQISLSEVGERLKSLSHSTGGGYIEEGEKESLIRNIGRLTNFDEVGDTAIGMHLGQAVRLKDIAEVRRVPAVRRGDASVNGRSGVILMLEKHSSADTLALDEMIAKTLADFQAELPPATVLHEDLFRQSDFIRAAIGNVIEALRDGTLIVAIILILFLLNLRVTLITLTAIPLSLVLTAICFHFFDIGINTMTLGGLAVAIGELVDDAIVDVENVHRRLLENARSAIPRPALRVIFEASSEIRNSIVLATVIVVLVFLPLFALPGLEGRLFTPIGVAYVISILASLLVSMTVTPVLCYYLLRRVRPKESHDTKLVRLLKRGDRWVLERTLDRPALILGLTLLLFLASAALIPRMGRDFLPPFNEGSAMAEASVKSGISLAASSELARKVELSLLEIPEVRSVGRRTGRAEEDDHASGVNHSEWEIALQPSERKREQIFQDIRERMTLALPADAFFSVSQPISHRLDHILSGVKAQVAIKLYGSDLRILRQQAAEIRNAVTGVPGVVDLQMEGQSLFPQYKIYPLRADLSKYGLSPGEVVDNLEMMLQGREITRLFEGDRIVDVIARLEASARDSIDKIRRLVLHTLPNGQSVRVEDVADVFGTSGPNFVERENGKRRIAISFNTTGRDIESTVEEVKERIRTSVKLPAGYHLEFDGQYESQRQAMRLVVMLGALALLGIFFVLFINFRSPMIALQIMVNIPLALIGSVVAVYLGDRTFSVATLIAFITLCGIASRNGIMMISHYIHLMTEEGESFNREMIIRGSLERLVPVLMTALTAMLALIPLVLAKGEAGKEILHPVAVVIVGGLLSSTLLDIVVTPVLFYRFGRKAAERIYALRTSGDDASPLS